MRIESVEIYSDATNAVVIRHPGRKFPGVLIQGDTLHGLCVALEALHGAASASADEDFKFDLEVVAKQLRELVEHYKAVLGQHQIELPFFERTGPD